MPDTLAAPTALARYQQVREFSETICHPLQIEDYVVQSMPDVSPTRWHLAHTTWFFETFVLKRFVHDYDAFDPAFEVLFNSYYNTIGEQFPRPRRGLLTRPTVAEVYEYRRHVDDVMESHLSDGECNSEVWRIIELGLHHEQQHQELILTDIKHVLACNPLFPAYEEGNVRPPPVVNQRASSTQSFHWIEYDEQLAWVGHDRDEFAFDNERPRHRSFVEPFHLGNRLVTCGEYLQFIEDGGYTKPELWLSEGWSSAQSESWKAPLYWVLCDGNWQQYTLSGLAPLELSEPICHVSYFEADAYARWAGARLPTEVEWEVAANDIPPEGNFAEDRIFHPRPAGNESDDHPTQMFGDVWEWTASQYLAYPGYQPPPGALGEYNGKFMCNQFVLRGGSCATSQSHIRRTYRNFFPPSARWQFTGVRLAK